MTCLSSICRCGTFNGKWYWSSIAKICVECQPDWNVVTFNGIQKCVGACLDWITFPVAHIYCTQRSARLMMLNDTGLITVMKTLGFASTYYFLGWGDMKNEGTYLYFYDGQTVSVSASTIPWCSGEPGGGSTENCVALYISGTTFCYHDYPCNGGAFCLCEQYL